MLWNLECRHSSDRFQPLQGSNHPSAQRNAACIPARLEGFTLCAKSGARAFAALKLCAKSDEGSTGPWTVLFLYLSRKFEEISHVIFMVQKLLYLLEISSHNGHTLQYLLPLLSNLVHIHKDQSWPMLAIHSILFVSPQPTKHSGTVD